MVWKWNVSISCQHASCQRSDSERGQKWICICNHYSNHIGASLRWSVSSACSSWNRLHVYVHITSNNLLFAETPTRELRICECVHSMWICGVCFYNCSLQDFCVHLVLSFESDEYNHCDCLNSIFTYKSLDTQQSCTWHLCASIDDTAINVQTL